MLEENAGKGCWVISTGTQPAEHNGQLNLYPSKKSCTSQDHLQDTGPAREEPMASSVNQKGQTHVCFLFIASKVQCEAEGRKDRHGVTVTSHLQIRVKGTSF